VANDEIGDVSVGVSADATGLPEELRRSVIAAGAGAGDDLAESLAESFRSAIASELKPALNEILNEIRAMNGQIATDESLQPELDLEIDTEEARGFVQEFVEYVERESAGLQIDAETAAAIAHVQALVEAAESQSVDIDVDAWTEEAMAHILAFIDTAERLPDVEVDVDANTRPALRAMAALRALIDADNPIVEIRAMIEPALAKVRAFLARVKTYVAEFSLRAETEKAVAKFMSLVAFIRNFDVKAFLELSTEKAKAAALTFLAWAKTRIIEWTAKIDFKAALVKVAVFTRDRFLTIIPKVSMAALAVVGATITGVLATSVIASGIGNLSGVLLAGVGGLLSIGSSLAAILPLALAIPGVLIAAAAAVGPLIVGLKGLKDELPEITDLLDGMKSTIQDAFNAEAVKPLREAIKTLGPELNEFLGPVSTSLGKLIGGLGAEFASALGNGGLRGMLSNLAPAIDVLTKNNGVFVDTFVRLGQVGNEFLVPLAEWINKIGTSFNSWLAGKQASGELTDSIRNAWFQAQELGRVLVNFVGIFSGLSDAAQAAGAGGLTGFADILGSMKDVINSPEFQGTLTEFFKASGVAASALGDALQAAGRMMTALQEPISQFIGGAGSAFAGLLESLFNALSAPAIEGGLTAAVQGMILGLNAISAVLPQVIPQLAPLLELFGTLASTVGPLVAAVLQAIAPVLGAIATALQPIVETLGGGLIDSLGAFADGFSKVGDGADGLQGILEGLAAGIAGLVTTLLPVVIGLIQSIVTAVVAALPSIATSFASMLPTIIQGATNLITTFVTILPTLLQAIILAITTALPLIGEALSTAIPMIIDAIVTTIPLLVAVLAESLPLIITAAGELFLGILDGLLASVPVILDGLLAAIPLLIEALTTAAPLVLTAAIDIFLKIVDALLTALPTIIQAIVDSLPLFVDALTQAIPLLITAAIQIFLAIITGLAKAIPMIVSGIIAVLPTLVGAVLKMVPLLLQAAIQIFLAILQGLAQATPQIISGIAGAVQQFLAGFSQTIPRFLSAGGDMMRGLGNGLKGAVGAVVAQAVAAAKAVVDAVKGALGIHSPSTVMAELGRFTNQGFADGIKGSTKTVVSAMRNMANKVTDAFSNGSINQAQYAATKSILDRSQNDLVQFATRREVLVDQIEAANKALEQAQKDGAKYQSSQINKILDGASVADDGSVTNMLSRLAKQVTKTKELTDTLNALKAAGVDDTTYKQFAEGGLASLKSAQALLAGGKDSIAQVAALQKQLGSAADTFANQTGDNLYRAGIQAAEGLVAGLESQSSQITKAMNGFADNMTSSIKKALGIASPSKLWRDEVGKMLGAGVVKGLEATKKLVGKAAAKLVDTPEIDPNRGSIIPAPGRGRTAGYATFGGGGATTNLDVDITVQGDADGNKTAQEVVNRLARKVGLG
jgi:phage-related protein